VGSFGYFVIYLLFVRIIYLLPLVNIYLAALPPLTTTATLSPRSDARSVCLSFDVPVRNAIGGSQMLAVSGSFLRSGFSGNDKRYGDSSVAYHVHQ
jgi:hypothetical protein